MQINSVSLHGDLSQKERDYNIKQFQNNDKIKVIVGTAGTGGFGIDLVQANTVVYYSNSYSLEERLQSEDRTHRAGQTKKVQYIDLLINNTIDIGIYNILKDKKRIADEITGDAKFFKLTQGI